MFLSLLNPIWFFLTLSGECVIQQELGSKM